MNDVKNNNVDETIETFGAFINQKRRERGMSLREFAKQTEISPVYESFLENEQKQAPSTDVLERMSKVLLLSSDEKNYMLDLAAKSMNKPSVSADLPDYIMDNDVVRAALRTAKDVDATDEEWNEFIRRLQERADKAEGVKKDEKILRKKRT